MSTQSATEIEWSVKLMGHSYFFVGIASDSKPECSNIPDMDSNAIVYYSNNGSPQIQVGNEVIHSNLSTQNNGDVIRFRFRPHSKKLVIDAVRLKI